MLRDTNKVSVASLKKENKEEYLTDLIVD